MWEEMGNDTRLQVLSASIIATVTIGERREVAQRVGSRRNYLPVAYRISTSSGKIVNPEYFNPGSTGLHAIDRPSSPSFIARITLLTSLAGHPATLPLHTPQ